MPLFANALTLAARFAPWPKRPPGRGAGGSMPGHGRHAIPRLLRGALVVAATLLVGLRAREPGLREPRLIANPVAARGNDPWVIKKAGVYYYCYSWDQGIRVHRNARLEEAVQFAGVRVWVPDSAGPCSRHVWAPELHFLRGRWYIYFAADDGDNANHRMFVLAATTPDPQGPYEFKGQLALKPDRWAIDGSILNLHDELYFIWSGWEGSRNGQQNIYLAQMSDPTTVVGPRILLSSPEHAWEQRGRPLINEGPTALLHVGKVFIVYSASGSWGNHYCLGLLELVGSDPLRAASWRKRGVPVFAGTGSVISPGHASFTRSPDDTEDWIVYHAARHLDSGWDRNTRIQPFRWAADGSPIFGEPVSPGVKIPAPSESAR